MTKVVIRNVVIDFDQDEEFEVNNVKEFLYTHFNVWPTTVKLYQDSICPQSEIPLNTLDDVKALEFLQGVIYVVIYPEGFAAIGIALIAATVGLMFFGGKNKASDASKQPIQRESPNNGLSERTNANRMNGRIPDIFGHVISTPDLIAQPYKKYESGKEIEYSYLCVGRGSYAISEIRDDKTLVSRIQGMSVAVYGPNTSPNSGSPEIQIGSAITEPLSIAIKSNDVTGQTLDPPSVGGIFTDPFAIDNVQKLYLNMICNDIQADIIFQVVVEQLNEADVVIGTYTVNLTLVGNPAISAAQTFSVTPSFSGKAQVKIKRTSEYIANPDYIPADPNANPPVVESGEPFLIDNLQWESMFSVVPVANPHFGNVTTVYVKTLANKTALEIKSRKINMRATRKVQAVNIDNTLGALTATSYFFDILVNMCVDPFIGNRTLSEIDIDNFRAKFSDIVNYFGTYSAALFNYTFDDENLSFEETINIVTESVFCVMYRRGSLLKLEFEKQVSASTILFNHRNKLPATEVRTVGFGYRDDKDGVDLEYVDYLDGSPMNFYLPADQSAVNPEKIKQLGVQNRLQAYFHAKRLRNKQLYENTVIEFDATQEALLVLPKERILVADNTRPNTFDGEIKTIAGSVLTLSQRIALDPLKEYTIFLQNNNGSIITKAVTQGSEPDQVILGSTAGLLLSLGDDLYARTTYEIVENSSDRKRAFLVQEKEPQNNFVTTIRGINYDDRYYQNDLDFLNGVVDLNGVPI